MKIFDSTFYFLLLLLKCWVLSEYTSNFLIEANEKFEVLGATYHAFENAWSISLNIPALQSVLVFGVCREPCPHVSMEYQIHSCMSILSILKDINWYNEYFSSSRIDNESICEDLRSSNTIQGQIDKILSDKSGAALMRFRHPNSLVVFYEQEVVTNWMAASDNMFGLTFRATQIEILGPNFGVRHFTGHVLLLNATQRSDFINGGLTFLLRNSCTAKGFSAPEFANVHGVSEAGRVRCVWECRGDMMKTPYNSAPPTVQQLNTSSAEYALLDEKYACIKIPEVYVAVIFGFTVDTAFAPSDIGYEQALFDAIDKLSYNVKLELSAAGLNGIIVFSVKDTSYHKSFSERLQQLQRATCLLANVPSPECDRFSDTVQNPNYVYRRRLLSTETTIEGLFISGDKEVFEQSNVREQHLNQLRSSLVDSLQEHSSSIGSLQNLQDIDFSQIVSFQTPKPVLPTTPTPSKIDEKDKVYSNVFVYCALGTIVVSFFYFSTQPQKRFHDQKTNVTNVY
jgi:hypothetical protein